jgi:hypothetical protein
LQNKLTTNPTEGKIMKNKKLLLLTGFLTIALSCPAFATGISASDTTADCDNSTLGTYQGESTLQAQWNANTINLDFYDGETKLSSGTCTYDGGIELPEDPTKTGYEFDGWRVCAATPQPQPEQCFMNLSGIPDFADVSDFSNRAGYYRGGSFQGNSYVVSVLQQINNPNLSGILMGNNENDAVIFLMQARCSDTDADTHNGQYGCDTDDWIAQTSQLTELSGTDTDHGNCWCQLNGVATMSGQVYQDNLSYWVALPYTDLCKECWIDCAINFGRGGDSFTGDAFRNAMIWTAINKNNINLN